jgi:hypothetical protein
MKMAVLAFAKALDQIDRGFPLLPRKKHSDAVRCFIPGAIEDENAREISGPGFGVEVVEYVGGQVAIHAVPADVENDEPGQVRGTP